MKQQTLLGVGPACRYHTFFASDCFLHFMKHIYHIFLLALGNVFLKNALWLIPITTIQTVFSTVCCFPGTVGIVTLGCDTFLSL